MFWISLEWSGKLVGTVATVWAPYNFSCGAWAQSWKGVTCANMYWVLTEALCTSQRWNVDTVFAFCADGSWVSVKCHHWSLHPLSSPPDPYPSNLACPSRPTANGFLLRLCWSNLQWLPPILLNISKVELQREILQPLVPSPKGCTG